MPVQSLKSKVAKGAVWTLLEKLSTQERCCREGCFRKKITLVVDARSGEMV